MQYEQVSDEAYAAGMRDVREKMIAAQNELGQDNGPAWVIYDDKTDEFPGSFVARLFAMMPKPIPTSIVVHSASLEELRGLIPPGMVPLARGESDHERIVETYI